MDLPFNIGVPSESGYYVMRARRSPFALRGLFGGEVLPMDTPQDVIRALLLKRKE